MFHGGHPPLYLAECPYPPSEGSQTPTEHYQSFLSYQFFTGKVLLEVYDSRILILLNLTLEYSIHLNSGLLQYLNGYDVSGLQMVRMQMIIWLS